MRDLIVGVQGWAAARGLLEPSEATRQALKMVSEVGEFAEEVLNGTKHEQMMEMGDVLVTAILTSHKLGFDIEEALAMALDKISKRTGKTVNGVFIKDE